MTPTSPMMPTPGPPPRYLLALDMDGTLLRDDKTIAPDDEAAIRQAAHHGIAVTIATGRLSSGALPTARHLVLRTPIICADGGLLVDPVTGETLHRHCISLAGAQRGVAALVAHGLVPFVFSPDAIHCGRDGEAHRRTIETWSSNLVVHDSLQHSPGWHDPEGVSVTVGIGARADVERAARHLQEHHQAELDTVHFGMASSRPPFGTTWAVRSLPHGCDKSRMLRRLAEHLGLPPGRVAVVGDWLNDLGMFRFAGRSFAMGQAPPVVKQAASDVLQSTSAAGGGIAEALERIVERLAEVDRGPPPP
jgi:Cof subfamily protein (haloacid dehalogenase superfamily)